MTLVYGKCVGIVKNTEQNDGTNDNCKWKSDNPNFQLASFTSEKVSNDTKNLHGGKINTLYIFK